MPLAAVEKAGIAQSERLRIRAKGGLDDFGYEDSVVASTNIVDYAALEPSRRIDQQRNAISILDAIAVEPIAGEFRAAKESRGQFLLIFSRDVNDKPA